MIPVPDIDPSRCHHERTGTGPNGSQTRLLCGAPATEATDLGPRCTRHAHVQRTRAILLCDRLDLSRDERHELAEFLTGHHGSWTGLSERNAQRVADALDAYVAVLWLFQQRRVKHRDVFADGR